MKKQETILEKQSKAIKYMNWTINLMFVILVILSLQLGFLSRQLYYAHETVILHDKINLEALSCVEDPYCNIDLGARDIYLDIKEAE